MSLSRFLGHVQGNDLARANRFEVEIYGPGSGRLPSLLCEEAQIPGLQALWSPTKIGMWTENRVHGMEFFGESAAFTFYCDTDWNVRSYFENWMQQVASFETKEPKYQDTYVGEVKVKVLNRRDSERKSWTMKEAFPRLLNIIPVAQGGDGIVRVTVTFAFRSWEAGGGGGSSIADIYDTITGGGNVREKMRDVLDKVF